MCPRTISRTPDLQPAAIDSDDCQCRARFHSGFESASLKLLDVVITIGPQFLTKLLGKPTGLPTTNSHLGEILQRLGSVLK